MRWEWSRRVVALALATAAPVGCAVLGADEEPRNLRDARERWAEAGVDDYTLDLERICFCMNVGAVRIVVVDGQPVSYTVVATSEALPEEQRAWYPTVPGLFDFVEEAIDRDAHRIDARYDRRRGYPLELFVDYDERIADEELGFRISAFTVQ